MSQPITIARLNPALHEVFSRNHYSPVFINQNQYIYASEGERDLFDKYWNHETLLQVCKMAMVAAALPLVWHS